VADLDGKLLSLVSSAATTDPNLGKVAYAPPPPAEEGAKSAPRRGPASRAPAAASPAGKPAAPTKPGPKRGADEAGAPAPKPTQGSAPAEIEP
jgi:hypothetical protein